MMLKTSLDIHVFWTVRVLCEIEVCESVAEDGVHAVEI